MSRSPNEPEAGARLQLPGCELGHPHFMGFLQEYPPFSPNVKTHPSSPVTTKHGGFQMFSGPGLKGLPLFPNTGPRCRHMPVSGHWGAPVLASPLAPRAARTEQAPVPFCGWVQSRPWSYVNHIDPKVTLLQSAPPFPLSKTNAVCTCPRGVFETWPRWRPRRRTLPK